MCTKRMHNFAQTIFGMGQSVSEKKYRPKMYLPGRTAVQNAVKYLSHKYRQDFASELRKGSLQYGGAIKIDGVHLKVQGRRFYDFTLHFIDVSVSGPFQVRRHPPSNRKFVCFCCRPKMVRHHRMIRIFFEFDTFRAGILCWGHASLMLIAHKCLIGYNRFVFRLQ